MYAFTDSGSSEIKAATGLGGGSIETGAGGGVAMREMVGAPVEVEILRFGPPVEPGLRRAGGGVGLRALFEAPRTREGESVPLGSEFDL